MNICALINTCQRPEGLLRTLEAIGDMPAIVLQDGGEVYVPDRPHTEVIDYFCTAGGKQGYWKRIGVLWGAAQCTRGDHFIHLTDDIDFDDDWLVKVISEYDRERPLNICVNNRPTNWGLTNYVDGAFIAPRHCFDALHWRIEPIPASRWERNPTLGSGVWAQVSRGWKLQHIIPKMISKDPIRSSFDPALSIMNPDRCASDT